MITMEQAKALEHGTILYSTKETNADGTPQRWRVNGKVKLWKRTPSRIEVPLKRGMYEYGYLTERDFHRLSLDEEESRLAQVKSIGVSVYNYSGRSTESYCVSIGGISIWFSYTTPVAFSIGDSGLVVRENVWGPTTGRHINDIYGQSYVVRIPGSKFEAKMAEALREVGLKY